MLCKLSTRKLNHKLPYYLHLHVHVYCVSYYYVICFVYILATPGRLNDLLMNDVLCLRSVTFLVIVKDLFDFYYTTRYLMKLIECLTWVLNPKLKKYY